MANLALRLFSGGPDQTSRELIQRASLEAAITEAVKRSDPSCEPFVGVILERIARNSTTETNWAVKGVKFGKSKREQCNTALSVIIDRLKREFEIAS